VDFIDVLLKIDDGDRLNNTRNVGESTTTGVLTVVRIRHEDVFSTLLEHSDGDDWEAEGGEF
jgi:hypothetical protein